MEQKIAQVVNKGMQRDYSMDKASQEFAYENKNIRITTTGNNSFLSITNEKSTMPYTTVKASLSLISTVNLGEVRWDFFVRSITGAESITIKVDFKDDTDVVIDSKTFTLSKHETFSYYTDVKAIKVTVRSLNDSANISKYSSSSTNVEIINNCEYIDSTINGVVLGSATLGNYLVLFTKDEDTNTDYIYKVDCTDTTSLKVTVLFEGNLNFNLENPIECISTYESDEVQKVYWVDGINQPRYINICKTYGDVNKFDFTPSIDTDIKVTIDKEFNGAGLFPAGVIQYYITTFNKYGSESNAIYISPLQYITHSHKGGEPGDVCTCSFKITIDETPELINKYDGVNIYSVIRSSLNAEPAVALVNSINFIPITESNPNPKVQITDTNTFVNTLAATDVLFLGGNTIIAKTLENKNNTLFLGNVEEITTDIITSLKENFFNNRNNYNLEFVYKPHEILTSDNTYYNYTPNLKDSSIYIKYFKYLEWYRIGIQFQLNTGEWTSVIYLKDIQCDLPIKKVEDDINKEIYGVYTGTDKEEAENYDYFIKEQKGNLVYTPIIKCVLKSSINDIFTQKNIKGWRLTVAEHTPSSRTVKAQGLLLPTLFNLKERNDRTCYSTPIWSIGTALKGKHLFNIDNFKEGETNVFSALNMLDRTIYEGDPIRYTEHLYVKGTAHEASQKDDYFLKGIKVKVLADRGVTISTQDSIRVFIYPIIGNGNKSHVSGEIRIAWAHRAFGQGESVCDEACDLANSVLWKDLLGNQIRVEPGVFKPLSEIKNIDFNSPIFRGAEFYSKNELRSEFVPFTNLYHETKTLNKELSRALVYNKYAESISFYRDNYFLDANICNFISPDVDNISSNLKLRLVGYTDINNTISDYTIDVESNVDDQGIIINPAKYNFNNATDDNKIPVGIGSFPLWPCDNSLFLLYYWHHSGYLTVDVKENGTANLEKKMFNLKSKTFANMWVSKATNYLNECVNIDTLADLKVNGDDITIFQSEIYKNKYENLLGPTVKHLYRIENLNETADLNQVQEAYKHEYVKGVDVDSNVVKSINIKSNTLNHCILDLGNVGQQQVVLPNYKDHLIDSQFNQILYENFSRLDDVLTNVTACGIIKQFKILENNIDITSDFLEGEIALKTEDVVGELFYQRNEMVLGTLRSTTYTLDLEIDFYNVIASGYVGAMPNSENERLLLKYFYNNKVYYIIINCVYKADLTDSEQDDYIMSFSTEEIYTTSDIKTASFKNSSSMIELNYTPVDNNIIGTKASAELVIDIKDKYNINGIDSKLWIGELYLDYDPTSFMGGTNEEALSLNTFIPIAGDYTITPNEEGKLVGYGLEGDTYYQRWDYLRVEPIASDNPNRPIDALSMMIETYRNLDGDYKELRGRLNTVTLTKENTNDAVNPIYSQSNNYKTYTILDEKFLDSTHPTLYTWSLSKQNISDIDNWTKVNLASANKLDGDKGELTKLKNWNDKLLAFQEKGIAMINYNQQTTLTTSDGVPVEIANSGKVSGHYYLSTTIGCKNKWSIVSSPYGLYFIDSYNKSINVFAEAIKSLSTVNLFEDWIIQNEYGNIWTPKNEFKAFKSFYDPVHKEVYFVNGNDCLCYNELLQQFTSFYDYNNMSVMETINGHIYSMCKEGYIYKMFEGKDCCNLFNNQCDYYMKYKINHEPFTDKVWTNIEYRADIFNKGNLQTNYPDDNKEQILSKDTFDTLKVWNEYQEGVADLNSIKYPNKAQKFRIWRADIPRDNHSKFGKDRIRNPWLMLELTKSTNTDKRMEFHDLLIKYLA